MDEKRSSPVLLGSLITVDLVDGSGESERQEFTIVAEKQADLKSGLLGENTPLGRALQGKHAGETIPYFMGDLREVRIIKVEKTNDPVNGEAAEKRRAGVREAANQSEIISQLIFATARGSKWGEYDVDVDKLLSRNDQETHRGSENPSGIE